MKWSKATTTIVNCQLLIVNCFNCWAWQGPRVWSPSGMMPRRVRCCADAECLKKLKKRRGLDRSFKCTVPVEVYEALEAQLHE